MTPKERAVAALNLRQPDQIPMFELEFQIEKDMFGKNFLVDELSPKNIHKLSEKEKECKLTQLAEDIVYVYEQLDYAIIPGPYGVGYVRNGIVAPELKFLHKKINEIVGGKRMIGYHGDGTFSIPDGEEMFDFVYEIADDPDAVHEKAKNMMEGVIKNNYALAESGVEVSLLCSDYCYNSGPFLSPAMFGEFIQPYLAKIIEEAKKAGMYTIKHTDGNIMPIISQLVECKPHALHSLDPMAGVDIKEVKEKYGAQICLCGNVNCSYLQTGTEQQLIESAEYCLTHAKPGGGYIFCTSNVPFKGVEPHRYQLVLDTWKRMRDY